MTYFAKTRFSGYRKYWAACAAISVASFYLIFGSTVLHQEIEPIFYESGQWLEMQESSSKMEYFYQHPWRIFKLYTILYASVEDYMNRKDLIAFGVLILSFALPTAFLVSLYYCWNPISNND